MSSPPKTSKITLLSGLELFRACTGQQLEEIASLCDTLQLPAGALLCSQGSRARQCLVIVAGSALASVDGETVGSVVRGTLIGHRTILHAEPSAMTLKARSVTDVVVFSRRDFLTLAIGNPSLVPQIEERILAPDPVAHPAAGRLVTAGV